MTPTPVHVIRHAKAGDRGRWSGPDDLRPLTKVGRRQARRLVEMYADRPFVTLASSPAVRCIQTLEPLAAARGLPIATHDELAEGMPFDQLERLVLETARTGPGVVCVHGDVLQSLIDSLLERGIESRSDGQAEFEKGSTWILSVESGAVTAAEYLPPPLGREVATRSQIPSRATRQRSGRNVRRRRA